MSAADPAAKLARNGLLARRVDLQRAHEAAVARLEAQGTVGPPPRRGEPSSNPAIDNLRECGRIYDALDDVQRQIDGRPPRERSAPKRGAYRT